MIQVALAAARVVRVYGGLESCQARRIAIAGGYLLIQSPLFRLALRLRGVLRHRRRGDRNAGDGHPNEKDPIIPHG
jgi:hypothetical protein